VVNGEMLRRPKLSTYEVVKPRGGGGGEVETPTFAVGSTQQWLRDMKLTVHTAEVINDRKRISAPSYVSMVDA
jgi:hypothetical protein